MARGYTTRKLEVWSVHAFRGPKSDQPVDYEDFFERLADLSPEARVLSEEDKLVAIPRLDVVDQLVWLTAYEGSRGLNPLIFNTTSAQERIERLSAGEILATKTHAVINLKTRDTIIEYNHRGAKAADIERVLEAAGRAATGWDGLKVDLTPVVATSFVEEIDRFARIRVASARLVRPNVGWSDWEDKLTESADESGAQAVQVEYTAPRGESISKQSGVVPFIKRLSTARRSPLKGASVTGRRPDEAAETTVSSTNYIEHQRTAVRLDADGHVDDADIDRHLKEFEEARQPLGDGA
jgi:hypothetical protein